MSTFLYRRGKGAKRRVAHLARFSPFGDISSSWCGETNYNTSCNLPLGLRICKKCKKKLSEYEQ